MKKAHIELKYLRITNGFFQTDGFGEMEKGRTNSKDIYEKSRKNNTDL